MDAELCIACGSCAESCQFGAIALVEGTVVVDSDACMGCGVCTDRCAQGAVRLVRSPDKGDPLELRELIAAQ